MFGGDVANLVISKWTGGAHCCFSLQIFELGRDFKIITNIEGGNFHPYFEDLDKDGIPEIKITDDFFAYEFSSFAYSATADVILKYSEGSYKVAAGLMKKPAPDIPSLNKKIQSWQMDFEETTSGDYPPPEFIQTVTDLFFTGHKELAEQIIDWAWPNDIPGKAEFIMNYENALKDSQFYQDFENQAG